MQIRNLYRLVLSLYVLMTIPTLLVGQLEIKSDTVFYNRAGIMILEPTEDNKILAYYNDTDLLWEISSDLKPLILNTYPGYNKVKYRYSGWLIAPCSIQFIGTTIVVDQLKVGSFQYDKKKNLYVTIRTRSYDRTNDDYLEHRIFEYMQQEKGLKVRRINFEYDYTREDYIAKKESEKRFRKEKEEFEEFLLQKLSRPQRLSEIEGIYNTIDLKRADNKPYSARIAIIRSAADEGSFDAWLMNVDDTIVFPWRMIFRLEETANPYLFLLKYKAQFKEFDYEEWKTKEIEVYYQSKIAQFKSGVFALDGDDALVKMYPSKKDLESFIERTKPELDWDASGSGILLSNGGLVVTNYHVVEDAARIRVKCALTPDSTVEFKADLVDWSKEYDLAVLQIKTDLPSMGYHFKTLELDTNVRLGEEVFTLGYPISYRMGEDVKLATGRISSKTGGNNRQNYFQTSLPVWYGNSGGACFDKNGNITGVVSEILWDRGNKVENVSYISNASNIVELLKKKYPEAINIYDSYTEKGSVALEDKVEELAPQALLIKVKY